MYIERTIEKAAMAISETYPVLLITGPQQVGKTTLLQKLTSLDRKYVSLDNPTFREIANNEPELFLQRFSTPVIIDEIQYATGLLEYIKIYVDTHKNFGDFGSLAHKPFI